MKTNTTKIEWATHSFNPWAGCSKVSPACANCYAESWAKRSGYVEWGPGKPRRRTSDENWVSMLKLEQRAAQTGERPRVFGGSLMDWLDPEVPMETGCAPSVCFPATEVES